MRAECVREGGRPLAAARDDLCRYIFAAQRDGETGPLAALRVVPRPQGPKGRPRRID